MKNATTAFLGAVFVSASVSACGGASAPAPELIPRSLRAAVLEGSPSEDYAAVVALLRYPNEAESEFCTAALIMPDLLLTARHCVSALQDSAGLCFGTPPATAKTPYPAEVFYVDPAAQATFRQALSCAAVHVPVDDALCGNDLAAVQLEDPLWDVTLLALRLTEPPMLGESITVVGYGEVQPGQAASVGERRVLDGATVEAVGATDRTVESEWIVDHGPCAGDSGGPALDVEGRVVGVMSRGSKKLCQSMIYQQLPPHAGWLRALAWESAERLQVEAPEWAKAEPLDSDAQGGGQSDADAGDSQAGPSRDDGSHGGPDASTERDAGATPAHDSRADSPEEDNANEEEPDPDPESPADDSDPTSPPDGAPADPGEAAPRGAGGCNAAAPGTSLRWFFGLAGLVCFGLRSRRRG
jgi:hypothetical protein